MKKWSALLLIFLSVTTYAQLKDSVYYTTPNFIINYSEVLEGPRSIRYTVMCPSGTASRSGMDFYKEKQVHTSDNDDYVANEWDKGHMAPAASFNCDRNMLLSTFTYVNSSLQQQSLNRGVWKKLEVRERELAKDNEVKVFIRVEYGATPNRVPANAAIPVGYYKELKVGNKRECYYFKNVKPETSDLEAFKCNCRNVIR
jgi:DNA/RNA endonuclease G (NUC1)